MDRHQSRGDGHNRCNEYFRRLQCCAFVRVRMPEYGMAQLVIVARPDVTSPDPTNTMSDRSDAVMTPALMVLVFMTNDFLSMLLTTDRATGTPVPSKWRMRNITLAGWYSAPASLRSPPGFWPLANSASGSTRAACRRWRSSSWYSGTSRCSTCCANDVACGRRCRANGSWRRLSSMSGSFQYCRRPGFLMEPLPWRGLAAVAVAAVGFTLILDQIKLPVRAALKVA